MVKIVCVILITLLLTTGCVKNTPPAQEIKPPKTSVKTIEENTVSTYFPLLEDAIYTYKGTGNEYAAKISTMEYLRGRITQFNTNNGGTSLSEVFIVGQGVIKKTFSKGESYWREDFTGMKGQEEIILQQPFKTGTTWKSNGKIFRIADTDAKVTVPYGTYGAIKVVNELQDATFSRYFSPDIGIIKEEYLSKGNFITSELAEIKIEPSKMRYDLYYLSKKDEKLVVIKEDTLFHTNESIAEKVLTQLKNPPSAELSRVIPLDTRLLSYHKEDSALRLNFSKELLTGLNAGAGFEELFIDAIVNTFAKAYGMEGVIINVEDMPYESGHFGFGKDEVLKVK